MAISDDRKKFPIGTKIRFIASERSCIPAKRDDGRTGEVVEHVIDLIGIHLPGSNNNYRSQAKETTWLTKARNLRILSRKNQQLTFAFYE